MTAAVGVQRSVPSGTSDRHTMSSALAYIKTPATSQAMSTTNTTTTTSNTTRPTEPPIDAPLSQTPSPLQPSPTPTLTKHSSSSSLPPQLYQHHHQKQQPASATAMIQPTTNDIGADQPTQSLTTPGITTLSTSAAASFAVTPSYRSTMTPLADTARSTEKATQVVSEPSTRGATCKLHQQTNAMEILEELLLVGMNRIQFTANSVTPLRKRELPQSFWDFCGADKKIAAQETTNNRGGTTKKGGNSQQRGGGRGAVGPMSTSEHNRSASATSVFMPIKEEGTTPPRRTTKKNAKGAGASTMAWGTPATRRRYSTSDTGKPSPKRPRTPKKAGMATTAAQRAVKGKKVNARSHSGMGNGTPAPSRKRAKSSSSVLSIPNGQEGIVGMIRGGHTFHSSSGAHNSMSQFSLGSFDQENDPDSPLSDSFSTDDMLQDEFAFPYVTYGQNAAISSRNLPERSMSCPILDVNLLHFDAEPAGLYKSGVFMPEPETTRSSVDMSGTEVIGLLGDLEVSHVVDTALRPSPVIQQNAAGCDLGNWSMV